MKPIIEKAIDIALDVHWYAAVTVYLTVTTLGALAALVFLGYQIVKLLKTLV